MNRHLKYIIILAVCIILSNQLIHLYYLYKEVTTQYRHQQNDIITRAVYEFNMLSTNVAQGDLVSYNASEKQLVYYINKKTTSFRLSQEDDVQQITEQFFVLIKTLGIWSLLSQYQARHELYREQYQP